MAKAPPTFDRHPGKPLYRLAKVDDRADVEIGRPEKYGGKCGPHMRSSKWNGQCWLDVELASVVPDVFEERLKKYKGRDCLEIQGVRTGGKSGKKSGEVIRYFVGSTEIAVEWASYANVPKDSVEIDGTTYRVVDLELGFPDGLTFHKQLALTQEEIDGGAVRPDDVVNSYAAYWPESGRILKPDGTERVNYEMGKYAHVYRPKLIADNNESLWCDQTIILLDPARLRVYLPEAWLSAADYPVVLDPTFGYTSAGGSYISSGPSDTWGGGQFAPATSGSASSISCYMVATDTGITTTFGLYSDSSTWAATRLRDTGSGTLSTSASWHTLNLDSAYDVVASTNYWVALGVSGAWGRLYYDSVGGFYIKQAYSYYSAGSMPNPMPSPYSTYTDRKLSSYVTYTEPVTSKARIIGGGVF